MKPIELLLRRNILSLKPYSSARDEYSGEAAVFLDANENPFNQPYNRYPDPYQRKLKEKISKLKGVDVDSVFLGNGSDEPIDLLFRVFCEPGVDNVVSIDPTYGMYQVAADINNIAVKRVLLTDDYQLDVEKLLAAVDDNTKMIFLCSPNNPTGNLFNVDAVEKLLNGFDGIVVLDEAYIDFAPGKSFLPRLNSFPNLVVLQTFSKAWGMAGLRLGMAFADRVIIKVLSKVKYPYNLNILTQLKALELLDNNEQMNDWVRLLLDERKKLESELEKLNFIVKVYPSDSNFILAKTNNPKEVYNFLVKHKIIIRDRSSVALCEGCLRFTVGSPVENEKLINALKGYK
ncbi:MAG: histidinol-phosphate transaminase [Marinilabiliaceae bacterium]|nr:histidinol-phosphate transaminase [Marinilabiliaceae bacterium]